VTDPFADEATEIDNEAPGTEGIIQRAVDLVNSAKAMPLSASVLVSRDELVDLLTAALEELPDELRRARWLLREREEFLAERTREAEALMEEVRVQAERMVSRTEIVRQANQVAQRILDDANEEARRMRHEAEDYCDQKLAGMEIVLERIMRTVRSGREKLQATAPPSAEGPAPAEGPAAEDGEAADGFFDQDLSYGRHREKVRCVVPEDPFVVHVARLRRVAGARWHEVRRAEFDPEHLIVARSSADSVVPDGAQASADLSLQSFDGGVMVTGTVSAPWSGVCRRCTTPVAGELAIAVRERFCEPGPRYGDPDDEEAYSIVDDELDLRPMVHDAVVLELPLAPLCREDCRGLCPTCGNDRNAEPCGCVAPRDPRWANLDVLRSAQ
jgi:uncharacterized metal-binding protein YceD (DUF177 family)